MLLKVSNVMEIEPHVSTEEPAQQQNPHTPLADVVRDIRLAFNGIGSSVSRGVRMGMKTTTGKRHRGGASGVGWTVVNNNSEPLFGIDTYPVPDFAFNEQAQPPLQCDDTDVIGDVARSGNVDDVPYRPCSSTISSSSSGSSPVDQEDPREHEGGEQDDDELLSPLPKKPRMLSYFSSDAFVVTTTNVAATVFFATWTAVGVCVLLGTVGSNEHAAIPAAAVPPPSIVPILLPDSCFFRPSPSLSAILKAVVSSLRQFLSPLNRTE